MVALVDTDLYDQDTFNDYENEKMTFEGTIDILGADLSMAKNVEILKWDYDGKLNKGTVKLDRDSDEPLRYLVHADAFPLQTKYDGQKFKFKFCISDDDRKVLKELEVDEYVYCQPA